MATVFIENEWIETAKLLGDVRSIVREALRAYFVQQCQKRIADADDKIGAYDRKYNFDYKTFKKSVQTDEEFLTKIESQNPLWEQDAIEWEYRIEEKQTWNSQLTAILQR